MDIIGIIITIAICIGALIALYFLLAGIALLVASRQARKTFNELDKGFESDFFKSTRRRP